MLERKARFYFIFMTHGVCLALRALFNRFKGCSSHGNESVFWVRSSQSLACQLIVCVDRCTCPYMSIIGMSVDCYVLTGVRVLICVSGLTSTNFCLGMSFPLFVKVYQVLVDGVAPMKIKFWINQLNYLGFSSFTGSNKLSRLIVNLWQSRHDPSRWNGTTTFRVSLPTSAQSRPLLTDTSEVYLLSDSRSCQINTIEHHSANIGTSTHESYASLLENILVFCVSFLTRWQNTLKNCQEQECIWLCFRTVGPCLLGPLASDQW